MDLCFRCCLFCYALKKDLNGICNEPKMRRTENRCLYPHRNMFALLFALLCTWKVFNGIVVNQKMRPTENCCSYF